LRTISPLSLAREVIAESAFREGDRREGIRDIIQMVSNARGLELSLGCLDGAVSCLDEVCC